MKLCYHLFTFLTLLYTLPSFAQDEVRLVTELGPGAENGFSDEAEIIGTIENSIVISDNGNIIISNGFETGTKIIGEMGTNGRILHARTTLDGKLYFLLQNSELDYSLAEVDPELQEMRFVISNYEYISNLIAFQGALYMSVEDPDSDEYFAKANPQSGEVAKVFDINSFGGMRDIVVHNDMMYTIHWSADKDGAYLASNDGTPGSLNEFYFFYDGSDFSTTGTINMTSAGNNIYMWYNNGDDDYVLFVSDGSESGTLELEDSFERINFYDYDANRAIGTIGNNIFFLADIEGDFKDYLWMSDGTVAGTQQIEFEDLAVDPRFFTNYNGLLYFRGVHTSGGFSDLAGLMVTDGTAAGTEIAWDVNDHPELQFNSAWHLIEHNNLMYFDGNSSTNGSELFVSDGTLANTTRLSDISPGDADGFTYNYRSAGDNLFFFGSTPESGIELYVYGPGPSSVSEVNLNISINPNPAHNSINLQGKDFNGNETRITDMSGKLIKTTLIESNQINVSDLLPGNYMLHIQADKQLHTTKFIKL